jgi:hypothetical protein
MVELLSLKELHRPPPSPRVKTSTRARYVTDNTNAAQRLRAVGRNPTSRCLRPANAIRHLATDR